MMVVGGKANTTGKLDGFQATMSKKSRSRKVIQASTYTLGNFEIIFSEITLKNV